MIPERMFMMLVRRREIRRHGRDSGANVNASVFIECSHARMKYKVMSSFKK